MIDSPPIERSLRRLGLATFLLVLLVTTLSAFMRLANAGLGCDDWPTCYGAQLRATAATPVVAETAITVARMLHRLSAIIVLVLAVTMAAAAFTTRPRRWREGVLAIGLVLIALGLAVLGRYTAGAKMPIIAIGNVLGGFAMLVLGFATWRGKFPGARMCWPALVLMVLLIVQIAVGVLVSASFSGLSCTALPACGAAVDLSWPLLDPTRVPQFDATLPIHPQGAFAHMLHRGLAVLVTLAALATARAAWRRGHHRAATIVVGLLALQVALGLTLVVASLPFAAALLHNLVGALLLVAASACVRLRPSAQ